MRRAARLDANHHAIVRALVAHGVTVQPLTAVGDGCPDAACWFRGKWTLLEFKAPKGKLTPAQVKWRARFQNASTVVRSEAEALSAVGIGAADAPGRAPGGDMSGSGGAPGSAEQRPTAHVLGQARGLGYGCPKCASGSLEHAQECPCPCHPKGRSEE